MSSALKSANLPILRFLYLGVAFFTSFFLTSVPALVSNGISSNGILYVLMFVILFSFLLFLFCCDLLEFLFCFLTYFEYSTLDGICQ